MPVGTVKWFNNAKGFGFILSQEEDEDLFAHYSAIEMDGYKTLKAGQTVSYELTKGQKGMHATHIQVINADTVSLPKSPAKSSIASSSKNLAVEEAM